MLRKKFFFNVFNVRARKKILVFFLASFLILFGLLAYIKFLVTPLLVETGQSKIGQESTKAMNYSVYNVLSESINYDDLIEVVTDSSGKISLIHANAIQINVLSRKIIEETDKRININLTDSPLSIPLGAFSGIAALAGVGPKINFDIIPYSDVNCDFISEFTSAGINQTHHKIFATITALVNVVLPFNSINVKETVKFLVCESIILGEIPDTYLNSSSLDEMMNLIP